VPIHLHDPDWRAASCLRIEATVDAMLDKVRSARVEIDAVAFVGRA
jgi:hypothetical protein